MIMKPDSVNYVAAQDNTLRDTAPPLGRCRNSWAPTIGNHLLRCRVIASAPGTGVSGLLSNRWE
jgi:hypothetical protein